eukprot:gene24365-biopygen8936
MPDTSLGQKRHQMPIDAGVGCANGHTEHSGLIGHPPGGFAVFDLSGDGRAGAGGRGGRAGGRGGAPARCNQHNGWRIGEQKACTEESPHLTRTRQTRRTTALFVCGAPPNGCGAPPNGCGGPPNGCGTPSKVASWLARPGRVALFA